MAPDKVNPYRVRFLILAFVVCILATALSVFLGAFASLLYGGLDLSEGRDPHAAAVAKLSVMVGTWWGGACGLLAGLLWCRWMSRRLRNGEINQLAKRGAWDGIKVGVLATLLLHIGLMLASHRGAFIEPVIGLACGIIAGVVLGAIFGVICEAMAAPAAGEPTTTEHDGEPQT